jgi:hypothetical protein
MPSSTTVPDDMLNFWIEAEIDGRSPISTGPRSSGGGFSLLVKMRDRGVKDVLRVEGIVDPHGQLSLRVVDLKGGQDFIIQGDNYSYLLKELGSMPLMRPIRSTAAAPRQRLAKAIPWSEEEAFSNFLDFLSSANSAAQNINSYLALMAEQEAEGEVKLPAQAEAWRNFLKTMQQRTRDCKSFLIEQMEALFGVGPEDVASAEEPAAAPPEK